jgi:hypothetical protein
VAITSVLRDDDRFRSDVVGYWLDHMAPAS